MARGRRPIRPPGSHRAFLTQLTRTLPRGTRRLAAKSAFLAWPRRHSIQSTIAATATADSDASNAAAAPADRVGFSWNSHSLCAPRLSDPQHRERLAAWRLDALFPQATIRSRGRGSQELGPVQGMVQGPRPPDRERQRRDPAQARAIGWDSGRFPRELPLTSEIGTPTVSDVSCPSGAGSPPPGTRGPDYRRGSA
jgi:hypothetical protein